MADEKYLTRPKTKPAETLKGKLNKWDNGYAEFIPQGQKPSNRSMLKQVGGNSFYKNEGEKESSYSLHLNVDGASEDPVAEMAELFLNLTKDQQKTKPQLPESLQGRMLYDDKKGLKVWLDTNTKKVTILACLDCTPDIERQLLLAQSTMNVTLGRYRSEIIHNSQFIIHNSYGKLSFLLSGESVLWGGTALYSRSVQPHSRQRRRGKENPNA